MGKSLVLSYGEEGQRVCRVVENGRSSLIPQLASQHDEADGVLLLHASHAGNTLSRIVICSPDTDVAVLSINFCSDIAADLWLKTGVKNNVRYININSLVQKLGTEGSTNYFSLP